MWNVSRQVYDKTDIEAEATILREGGLALPFLKVPNFQKGGVERESTGLR